jgi:hypothetical protein
MLFPKYSFLKGHLKQLVTKKRGTFDNKNKCTLNLEGFNKWKTRTSPSCKLFAAQNAFHPPLSAVLSAM